MRFIIALCMTISALHLRAQPVLHANEMLPFGSTMTLWRGANGTAVIDTTIQGADAVWDFSALIQSTENPVVELEVVNPSSTPHVASFPASNYAWFQEANMTYRYFNLSSSNLQRVGVYSFASNVYTDPQIEMVFPMQLGSTSTDTWDNTFSGTGGTYSFECLGTGTLILPGGTHADALMVRGFLTEGEFDAWLFFFWYSSQNGATLLEQYGYYDTFSNFWTPTTSLYLHSLATGIEDNTAPELLTWQNPVTDELLLQGRNWKTGLLPWRVMGLTGQVMSSGTFSAFESDVLRWSIPVYDLAPGMYVLWVGDAKETVSLRFVKE